MFKKFLKDLKLIVGNEGGFYVMAAMAATSMLQANSKKNSAMKAAAADMKLQRAKLERSRTRAAGDLATNVQRTREASQKRDVNIEKSRLNAESKIDETFAGSGISGTSVDELDNELNAEVSQNKVDNKKALDQNIADQFRGARQGAENDQVQAAQIGAGAPKGSSFMDQALAGAQGAQQGYAANKSLMGAGIDVNSAVNAAATSVGNFFSPSPTMRIGSPMRMSPSTSRTA